MTMTKPQHGNAIKTPGDTFIIGSFSDHQTGSINLWVSKNRNLNETVMQTWDRLEKAGYRCVRVEVREVE